MSEAEAREIVAELRKGVVERPKRWSGDVHADLGGSIDDEATDRIMGRAADEIERLSRELLEAREALKRIANVVGEDEPSIMWPWAQEIARSVLKESGS